MVSLPSPVRAALGLAVTVLDEARHLPDKAIELPMLAVSRALQLSLKAQQSYAALAARGDEVLAGRQAGDEPPPWARFDEPVTDVADGLDAVVDGAAASAPVDEPQGEPATAEDAGAEAAVSEAATAEDAVSEDAGAEAAVPEAATAQAAVPEAATAQAATAQAATAEAATADPPARPRARPRKNVRAPRNAAPSAFDRVSDD